MRPVKDLYGSLSGGLEHLIHHPILHEWPASYRYSPMSVFPHLLEIWALPVPVIRSGCAQQFSLPQRQAACCISIVLWLIMCLFSLQCPVNKPIWILFAVLPFSRSMADLGRRSLMMALDCLCHNASNQYLWDRKRMPWITLSNNNQCFLTVHNLI